MEPRAIQAMGQKAPSAIRCIKTGKATAKLINGVSQKAPSAIRCIKTCQ